MDNNVISQRYAEAIFKMAKNDDNIDEVREALNVLSIKYQEEDEFRHFLSNPTITSEEKSHLLKKVFNFLTDDALAVLNFVIDKDRVNHIFQIQANFLEEVYKEEGKLPVIGVFAKELSEEQKIKLIKKLEQKFKKKIILDLEVDETIIGGGIIKVGNNIINGSIKHQIEDMKRIV